MKIWVIFFSLWLGSGREGLIIKTATKKIGLFIGSIKFFRSDGIPIFSKSTFQPFTEYCFYVWPGVLDYYLDILNKLQKRTYRTVGPFLVVSREPYAH